MFERPEKAKAGGEGREFVYRAIVERHFGKHTGLPPFAKACPKDVPVGSPAARPAAEREASPTAPRRRRDNSVNPGESPWEFRSIPRNRASRAAETGRCQKSRRFRQREARE